MEAVTRSREGGRNARHKNMTGTIRCRMHPALVSFVRDRLAPRCMQRLAG
ncbi:hypothetical protein C7S16_6520 [Burkholderia thailandensis]|uniref:Uncharacterized protein n=1 Tax=Burkholderia thailandensis TaxID=57975 RepID=A0AAW9CX35_BURTH|nr:hypothetical protein [Burkholderia thailandensis]